MPVLRIVDETVTVDMDLEYEQKFHQSQRPIDHWYFSSGEIRSDVVTVLSLVQSG